MVTENCIPGSLLPVTVRAGDLTGFLPEDPGEVTDVAETHRGGDGIDGFVCGGQKVDGSGDAVGDQILVQGLAGVLSHALI